MRVTARRFQMLGSTALLSLTLLLAACGDEAPANAPAATATRAAGTATAAATVAANAATAATGAGSAPAGTARAAGSAAVATGSAAVSTAQVAGSAAVATATRAASAVASGVAGTSTSAALPTTAPMPTAGATAAATTAATTAATAAATPAAAATGAPAGTVTGGAAAPAGGATTAGAVRYTIGMGSEATYTVNEKFANLPAPNDAVARTEMVTGQLVLGPNGQVVEGGRVVVNVQSLRSDQDRRDNYIRNMSLQSNMFPEATFVIRSAEGLTGPLGGTPTNFRLSGDLTVRNVTKPVTWNVTATQAGDTINGNATLTVRMQDFEIMPPMVAILTTSDMAKLDLKIVARRAA